MLRTIPAGLLALATLLTGCVSDSVAPSDPTSITLNPNEIYGFVTMDSPETIVGFNIMCAYTDETSYKVTLGTPPCREGVQAMSFGTNDFIEEDAYQIRLADGTHVRIYRMLRQTASGPVGAFPGVYVQRYHGAGTIKNGVISDPAAVYRMEQGSVQYLGHVSGELPTIWKDAPGLDEKLADAIPSLSRDRVRMEADLTRWSCEFVPLVITSGGSWNCDKL